MTCSILLALASFLAAEDKRPEPSHAERIKGTWKIVSWELKGKKDEKSIGGLVRFFGDRGILVVPAGNATRFTYKLNPEGNPSEMDWVITSAGKEKNASLIYKWDGKRLILCFCIGQARPKGFQCDGDGEELIALEWVRPLTRTNEGDTKADLEKLRGNWSVVRMEADGDKVDLVKKMTFDDLKVHVSFTLEEKPTSYDLDIDVSEKVKHIELLHYDVISSFSTGIYDLQGDELTVCFQHPGLDRPKEFKSPKPEKPPGLFGSFVWLIKLRRDKK